MLRRFIAPLFVLLALAVVAQPWTARAEISPEQGKALVANIAERGINEVIAADVPLQEKVQRFRDMFLANFDVESTARFVLGRHCARRIRSNASASPSCSATTTC